MTNRLNDKAIAGAIAGADWLTAIVSGAVRRVTPATLFNLYRGVANGVASLDASSRLPMGQLPVGVNAIEALSSNGLITRTGASSATVSVIAGTTNKIGVTNGDGVAGNPTITIPATFNLTGHTVELPLGTTFGGTVLSALIAGVSNLPIGSMQWWPTDTPPTGWLARDGSLISRTTYAALFAVLVTGPGYAGQTFTVTIASPGVVTKAGHGFTGGERLRLSTTGALPTGLDTTSDYFVIFVDVNTFRLATSEANYVQGAAINTSGSQSGVHTYTRSLYGLGDGSTTFRLPDDRGLFMRGRPASGRAIGSYQLDAMRQYTMTGQVITESYLHSHSGVLIDGGASGDGGFNGAGIGPNVLNFSANNASYTVTAAENRPVNRAYLPIIKWQ